MPKCATLEQRIAWHVEHQKACRCRPIPDKLLRQMNAIASARSAGSPSSSGTRAIPPLRALLSGGDRRSVAQSKRARAIVNRAPDRVAEIAHLAEDADWLVSMRAMDLLEKLAHERAELIQPYKRLFIGPLADSDKWEVRLQIVRALPLLKWTPREQRRVVDILCRDVQHPQTFVRAWALDSLATFAQRDPRLVPIVERGLEDFERSASKALQARARNIRARLSVANPGPLC